VLRGAFGAGPEARLLMAVPKVVSPLGRVLVVAAAVLITALFAWAKTTQPTPLLGLSSTFDFYVLALAWVAALWLVGVFDRSSAKHPLEITLDDLSWHLDSVRQAHLDDSRAAWIGGLFLSWLVAKGGVEAQALEGLEESLDEVDGTGRGIAQLYEIFGEKLTTGCLTPRFAAFSTEYLSPETGAYFDDLEKELGPFPYAVDLTEDRIRRVHSRIDKKFKSWLRA
jgi:hypothetical protein